MLAVLLLTLAPVLADVMSDDHSLARFLHSSSSALDVPEADGDGERFDNQENVLADPAHPRNASALGRSKEFTATNSRHSQTHPVCAAPSTGPPTV